jgi:hypothetical protein
MTRRRRVWPPSPRSPIEAWQRKPKMLRRVCGGCGRTFEAHPGAVQLLPALRCVACEARKRADEAR